MFVIGIITVYNYYQSKDVIALNKEKEEYIVALEDNNCKITTQYNIATIQKYNGNAETIIIDADSINGDILEIDEKAFLECTNLDKILIDKSLVNNNLKIENFEINTEYKDEQYVEYKTIQEYSEAYQRYLQLSDEERNKSETIPQKYDVPISALYSESMEENYNVSIIDEANIPESFDLRDKINIKVENQGTTGTCFAYSSLTAVETNLALINYDYVDFSEVHLACLADGAGGYGGQFISSTDSYYADKIGPVSESEWPMKKVLASEKDEITKIIYRYLSEGNITNEELQKIQEIMKQTTEEKYVKETVNLPTIAKHNNNISYTEDEIKIIRNVIKTHIMHYGSLEASIASNDIRVKDDFTVLNSKDGALSHSVSIVGWDDNFSKYNFPEDCRPENDGAYLVLNSWGDDWGNNGCLWVSYEDHWIEVNLNGVIGVEDISENIKLTSMNLIDIEENKELSLGEIKRGINLQVEINTRINEIKDNQQELDIKVVSETGEEVSDAITITGKNIKNNESNIIINFNTKILDIGLYKINIKYGEETISRIIEINPNTFDYYIRDDGTIAITSYWKDETNIIIPEQFLGFQVTRIESEAFYNNDLQSITVYNNVIEAGSNIINQSTIIYGNTGSYIEKYANENGYIFIDLNQDKVEGNGWNYNFVEHKLYISEKLEEMPYAYLRNVVYKVELTDEVDTILPNQFENYINLNEVILPNTITTIGRQAFSGCINLTYIEIPTGVTKISDLLFSGCERLTNVKIPQNITSIGFNAFSECISLINIEIPEGVTDIGYRAFENCRSLTNIKIPENVTEIKAYIFKGCEKLTSVELPKGIKNIGNYAFEYCESLTDIVIPTDLTTIGFNAFEGCKSLENIEVPEGLTSIGKYAFAGCAGLTNFKIYKEISDNLVKNTINYNDISDEDIEIPDDDSSEDDSSNDSPDSSTSNGLGEYAFKDCIKLINIDLPNNLQFIGEGVFQNCESLQNISIPEQVNGIGSNAFNGCRKLQCINIPKGVTNIGESAFENCETFQNISIPEGVMRIEKRVFWGCKNVQTIEFSEKVNYIGEAAFALCENLQSIDIPEGITTITDRMFLGCKSLIEIEIPGGVTSIGDYAFYKCEGITNIQIFSNVEYIGEFAFLDCYNLQNLNIPEQVRKIGSCAFSGCRNLQSIRIPEGVTRIEEETFRNCISLTELYIPETVTYIGQNAFCGCTIIKTIENGTTTIQDIELPTILKRAMNENDILYYGKGIEVTGVILNEIDGKVVIDLSSGCGSLYITEGVLNGLSFYITVPSGTVTYSEIKPTKDNVIAMLHLNIGETIINNNGENTYRFAKNGEFEFKYINLYDEEMTVIAKVENIENNSTLEITSEKHEIKDQYILKILPKTTLAEIKQNIECNMQFEIIDLKENVVEETSFIGTGYKVRIEDGTEYILIVWGDFNGDGQISVADLARTSRIAVEAKEPSIEEKMIIDVSMDGNIMINDLAVISRFAIE